MALRELLLVHTWASLWVSLILSVTSFMFLCWFARASHSSNWVSMKATLMLVMILSGGQSCTLVALDFRCFFSTTASSSFPSLDLFVCAFHSFTYLELLIFKTSRQTWSMSRFWQSTRCSSKDLWALCVSFLSPLWCTLELIWCAWYVKTLAM